MDNILSSLNEEQRKAVKSENHTTLVLAGAGSGKTKVLTSRIAYLVNLGVEPKSILAMTFTNKAAGEMKKRILSMVESLDLDDPVYPNDFTIGTFHGFCHKILRRHYSEAGLSREFTVLDMDETKKFTKEVIEDLGYCSEIKDKKEKTKELKKITTAAIKLIGYYKDECLKPSDVVFTADDLAYYGFNGLAVYKAYEDEKEKMNSLDFGDLLLYVVDLFKTNNRLLNIYRELYHHILVDEFQDTNTIQSMLIDLLFNKKTNFLFVVGDDDQSIYEWRGANIENILNFPTKFKNTKIVKLEQNYRSTNNILNCANGLIGKNKRRMGKELWSAKENGSLINIKNYSNPYEEGSEVAQIIKNLVNKGHSPSDFAILYRTNYISRVIESKLNEQQLPYVIVGGTGFWSRMEIKDLMGYLTLTINKSNNMAFDKIVNLPSRKIGAKKLEQIAKHAKLNNISRFIALKQLVESKVIKGEANKNALEFIQIIESLDNEDLDLVDKITYLVQNTGLIEHYMDKDGEEKGTERAENLNELINAAIAFNAEEVNPDVSEEFAFIDYAILQTNADKESDGESVQLMTIHASKGLEFKNVFILGCEDGIFPSENALKEGRIEEERRLAYVAITRAEENLMLSFVDERYPRSPIERSRFISELPSHLITIHKQATNIKKTNNFRQNYNNSNWTKRVASGYKIGQTYRHDRFGKGIILTAIDNGDRVQLTINFKGLIGVKVLFIEKK